MAKPNSVSADPVIRALRATDRAEWLRLRRALWPDVAAAMHRCEMRDQAPRRRDRAVLVIDPGAGRLAGFIELSLRPRVDGSLSPRVGFVEGLYVAGELRRQGWGRKLIAAAETWAASRGVTEIATDTEIDNAGAIATYRALGFRETFRLVHFLKRIPRSRRR